MPTPGMPLRAAQIPDCTTAKAHHTSYEDAKTNGEVFVCIVRQGRHWKVELDAMTKSQHVVPDETAEVMKSAVVELVATGAVADGAALGPDYVSIWKIESEERAREIAAAFHAAMYGLEQPLRIAVTGSTPAT